MFSTFLLYVSHFNDHARVENSQRKRRRTRQHSGITSQRWSFSSVTALDGPQMEPVVFVIRRLSCRPRHDGNIREHYVKEQSTVGDGRSGPTPHLRLYTAVCFSPNTTILSVFSHLDNLYCSSRCTYAVMDRKTGLAWPKYTYSCGICLVRRFIFTRDTRFALCTSGRVFQQPYLHQQRCAAASMSAMVSTTTFLCVDWCRTD